jgi:hypothetical protein
MPPQLPLWTGGAIHPHIAAAPARPSHTAVALWIAAGANPKGDVRAPYRQCR